MRVLRLLVVSSAMLLLGVARGRADAPATEFFAIETSKLEKLAPTDAALDALSTAQLAEVSIVHGWYDGSFRMRFLARSFRIDARFGGSAEMRGGPNSITYHIDAGNDPASWDLLSEEGVAIRQGRQYLTEGWRKRRVTVVLRFLDLKR
jgi:hypothetical protein